jgi:hypothetical protein
MNTISQLQGQLGVKVKQGPRVWIIVHLIVMLDRSDILQRELAHRRKCCHFREMVNVAFDLHSSQPSRKCKCELGCCWFSIPRVSNMFWLLYLFMQLTLAVQLFVYLRNRALQQRRHSLPDLMQFVLSRQRRPGE